MIRVLELFCGIGGCAAALGDRAEVVAAVDINRKALDVYRHNHSHPIQVLNLDTISADRLAGWNADLWWISPPCQPYTRRGLQRDTNDPRARSLLTLIQRVGELQPRYLALENVPGFQGSRAHGLLIETLTRCGYEIRELLLCPTELGVPNRRRRYYLLAGLDPLLPFSVEAPTRFSIPDVLDREPNKALWVSPELCEQYAEALNIVDAADPAAVCNCFTSAYGRSHVRSGSYLRTVDGRVRRFSPQEILRFLCFPAGFTLPSSLSQQQSWPLVGNSLSIRPVQHLLQGIPF